MNSQKDTFLKQFQDNVVLFPFQADARASINNGLDFPTTRDEKWRHTKITSIINAKYQLGSGEGESIGDLISTSCHQLVFLNGKFQSNISSNLPKGVQMYSFKGIPEEFRDEFLKKLGALTDFESQAFQSFNSGYFEDGGFIKVDRNVKIDEPIYILNINSGEAQATNARLLIHIESKAEVSLVQRFEGRKNKGSFTNSVTEIFVDDDAKAKLYLIENEGEETSMVNSIQVRQERDSDFSMVTVTKSGQLVRNNIHVAIAGPGCETNMSGLYFTSGAQHVDNQTYADHLEPNCNSNELYKGVMADRSTGVFNGKIMVHQKAQKTNAFQSNQNILLSDRATINTKPELEIYADDVKCSHGCTIGQLDEEAMFYLQSRGLGKEAAHRLLVQAFAAEVIEKIEIDSLKESVKRFIESKFEK